MIENVADSSYWSQKYMDGKTGWDIGTVSLPLKTYFDQLTDKSIRILVPGAGFGWEAEYLFELGFSNVFVLDFAAEAIDGYQKRNPKFPESQLLTTDFFQHHAKYDLIVEQTFFCALPRSKRADYIKKMHDLLSPKGKLIGLLFSLEFETPGPPFGGTKAEYFELFNNLFEFVVFEPSMNSIRPRQHNEFFFIGKPKI